MTKKQKIMLVAAFAAVLIIIAGAAFLFNRKETQEGSKRFHVEIISERDDFTKTVDSSSDLTYLGEYLRTVEDCKWEESEYGIFVNAWYGMEQDADQGYWWMITVNGKEAPTGADEIPLQGGDQYTFTLTKF